MRRDEQRAFRSIVLCEAVKTGLVKKVSITKLLQTVLVVSMPNPEDYRLQQQCYIAWADTTGVLKLLL